MARKLTAFRRQLSNDDGVTAPTELSVGFAVLLLPMLIFAAMIPTWAEVRSTAQVAAAEAARAASTVVPLESYGSAAAIAEATGTVMSGAVTQALSNAGFNVAEICPTAPSGAPSCITMQAGDRPGAPVVVVVNLPVTLNTPFGSRTVNISAVGSAVIDRCRAVSNSAGDFDTLTVCGSI